MARVVVDANVLISARLSRDQNHERGAAIARGIDQGDLPTALLLSDVMEEVLNYLQARANHATAVETLDALIESSGYQVTGVPKSDFVTGRSLFRRYAGLSLTDAIIVAAMHRTDTEYLYSFDDDFDGIPGITRLSTADNPF